VELPSQQTITRSSRRRLASFPAGPPLVAAVGVLFCFLVAAPAGSAGFPRPPEAASTVEAPGPEDPENPATDFPPLRLPDVRAEDEAGELQRVPAGIDLETLEARLEWLPLRPDELTAVLEIRVSTAGTPGSFPEGAAFDVHIEFGEAAEDRGDAVLSARLVAPRPGARRRHAPADQAGRTALLRFSGPGDPGGLSSMVPGASITFRVPLQELLDTVPQERREAARHEDGSWTIHLWVTAGLGDAFDRLPDEGRAPYRFSPAPPDRDQKETSASFSS
jgi:hypothetical protein